MLQNLTIFIFLFFVSISLAYRIFIWDHFFTILLFLGISSFCLACVITIAKEHE